MKIFLLTLLLTGPLVFKTGNAQLSNREGVTIPTLEINLYARAMNGAMFLADGILQNFNNNFSSTVDNMDVRKFMNSTDNLAIKNGLYNLIVERRPMICITDTLRLMLTRTRIAPYRFEIDPSVISNTPLKSFLKDKYLGTETPVSMSAVTNINFNITADPLSRAADRFMIVYRNIEPVRFTAVTALRNRNSTITTVFKTENENNINTYTIQKSNDGITYETMGEQMPTANNFGNPYYNYTDFNAALSEQWYRIKANTISGETIFSMPVKADKAPGKTMDGLTVFPNPVTNGVVNIALAEQPFGLYKLQILNTAGQTVYAETLNVQTDKMRRTVMVSGMKNGIYRLLLTDANGKKTVKTIIAK